MTFHRQLDILMAILATVITFLGSIFILGLTLKIGLLLSCGVLLAGLVFGRGVARTISEIF